MIVVRYADDIMVGFELEAEARRFWDVIRESREQFSVELHGDKPRLLESGPFAAQRRKRQGLGSKPAAQIEAPAAASKKSGTDNDWASF